MIVVCAIFVLCRNGYFISACLLIVLHDFLDHLDGIVAKVQRKMYGPRSSDPLLGGFLDAFCDKVCGHGAISETDMLEKNILVLQIEGSVRFRSEAAGSSC